MPRFFKHLVKTIVLLSLFCLYARANASVQDRLDPEVEIIRPVKLSVISTNSVRVVAEINPHGRIISEVVFYASYKDANRYRSFQEEIGIDTVPPYEVIWDCSRVMDQCFDNLAFYCKAFDEDGEEYESGVQFAILDRNQKISAYKFISDWTSSSRTIDGEIDKEWDAFNPMVIDNDDNHYKIFSCWDNENLYLMAEVKDQYIFNRYKEMTNAQLDWDSTNYGQNDSLKNNVWLDDCVMFLIDVNGNKTSLPEPSDIIVALSPTGTHLALRNDFRTRRSYNLKGFKKGVSIIESENPDSLGYVIELALPWKVIGIDPLNELIMGFEVYMVDREAEDGPRVISSWSVEPHNHMNASEWGSIVLKKGVTSNNQSWLLWGGVIGALLGGILVFFKKKNKTTVSKSEENGSITPLTRQEQIVKKAETFLKENFKNANLNRNQVASVLNISNAYLSELFKKNTGKTLPYYLNELRVEEAKLLLQKTEMKITEIAIDVWFNASDHFIKVFKSIEGVTPNAYRKNFLNST